MEWFYAVGDKQMGPVPEEEFKRLAADGTIRPDTLVWSAGMDNWRPYREIASASVGTAPPASELSGSTTELSGSTTEPSGSTSGAGSVVCRECGKIFPPEEVVKFGDAFVCASCKPVYVQRLREGAPGADYGATVTEEELLARDYDVEVGEALSRGWELFKDQAGILIGATLVAYLVLFGVSLIPFLGGIAQWVINGPILGGLWLIYIGTVRGQEMRVGDVFGGFGPRFGNLFATSVVSSLLTGACMLPVVAVGMILMGMPLIEASQSGNPPNISPTAIIATVVVGIPCVVAAIYLSVAWFFALPLAADKSLGFWSAMNLSRRIVNRRFWGTFLLLLVCWLILMVSLVACILPVLVAGPVVACAISWHYQRVMGDLAAEQD